MDGAPKQGIVNATTNLDELHKRINAINDHDNHISKYPAIDMTFGEYQKLLNQIEWNCLINIMKVIINENEAFEKLKKF